MRLRIYVKVSGLIKDKFGGGVIGKKKRSGESHETKFGTNAFNCVTQKTGGMNLQVIVCRVCQGKEWEGCSAELNLKFYQSVRGLEMIK